MNQLASHDKGRSVTTNIANDNVPFGAAGDQLEPLTSNESTTPSRYRSLHLPSANLAVGSRLGSYRIDKYLDRGGMAAVYQALDLKLDRRVALKVLNFELARDEEFRRRFLRESRFAASLDHPSIVPIYEANEAGGFLYIAMRYVSGGNLEGFIAERGALQPRHALAILTPIADALDAAHSAGLIHRDVKPANILLDSRRGRAVEHLYLSDFGVSKQMSGLSKLTGTGNFIGTVAYTAPEQIRGEAVDARSDLYSLACVTYECLTGELPFRRDNQAAVLWAHQYDNPKPVSLHRPELHRVDPLIRRALSKDPTDRFYSCGEFIAALSEAMLGRETRVLNRPDGLASDHEPPLRPPIAAKVTSSPRRWVRSVLVVLAALVPLATGILSSPPALSDSWALTTLSAIRPGPLTGDFSNQDDAPVDIASPPAGSETPATPTDQAPTSSSVPPPPSVQPEPARAIPTIDGPAIEIGHPPDDVATTPDGRLAYVASSKSGTVVVLDLSTGRPVAHIPIAVGPPRSVAVSPDGVQVFVSVYNDDETTNVVVVIDAGTMSIAHTIPVDRAPHTTAFSPDGRFGYVPSAGSHVIDIIDVATAGIVQKVLVPPGPHSIAIAPNGKLAYIANHESNVVTILETATNTVIDTISVGAGPHSVAVAPDGAHVAVNCRDSNEVYFIDTVTNQVVGAASVGSNPSDLAYSPDSDYVYTTNMDSGSVSVIDADSHNTTADIPASAPTSITLLNNGSKAFVTNADTNTLTVLTTA